jgi:hypothetical protein
VRGEYIHESRAIPGSELVLSPLAPFFHVARLLCSRARVSELDGPVDQIEAQDGPIPCDRRVPVLHVHAGAGSPAAERSALCVS